ncbi:hypothetical protein [Paenibacillus lactis]|nr:hypothetical protein [Paenibacillus lactis]
MEFVIEQYGIDTLNEVIRNPHDFNRIFQCSELELHQRMVDYLKR